MDTPITYYGGKQRLSSMIVDMIPPHEIYCEPFFGGGAVFFRKPKAGIEVINDHDDTLINFYLQVQNNFEELQALVRNTLHSEGMYRYAKDVWNERVEATDVEKAWAVWLITNGSFAGSMHGGWKWCNGRSGGHSGISLRNKRNKFQKALHERLSDVQISCRDAIRVIQDRDSEETFFYIDPPYPGCYQQHYSGYTHKDLYDLLQLLSGIKGNFILSSYWCQVIRWHVVKHGWNFREVEVNLKVANLGDTPLKKRTEVLVYNFEKERDLFNQWERK